MPKMSTNTEHYEAWKKLYSDPHGVKTTWHLQNCRFIEGYDLEFSGSGSGELYLVSEKLSTKIFLGSDTTHWESASLLQMIHIPRLNPTIKLLNVRGDCKCFVRLRFLGLRKTEGVCENGDNDGQG